MNINLPALSSDTNIGRYLDQIRRFPMLEKDREATMALFEIIKNQDAY